MDLKFIFNHSLQGAEHKQVRGDLCACFCARCSQQGLQKFWLKDKIIFWEKFETQAFHPDRKYDEAREKMRGRKESAQLSTLLWSFNQQFFSFMACHKKKWLSQRFWLCVSERVIFATGYVCFTNYHPSHTHCAHTQGLTRMAQWQSTNGCKNICCCVTAAVCEEAERHLSL